MKIDILKRLSMMNILLIQDNKSCNDEVYNLLYEVSKKLIQTTSKGEVELLIEQKSYDMVVIDFSLSNYASIEFIKAIRELDIMIPIIGLCSTENKIEVLSSINLLIEGFIIKPINKDKLISAVENCIARIEYLKPAQFILSQNMSYLLNTHELLRDEVLIPLAKKEAQLLELLIKNIGRIVLIEEIEWELWDNEEIGENALKSVIQRLRKEIGKEQIRSHSGIGYSLDRRGA